MNAKERLEALTKAMFCAAHKDGLGIAVWQITSEEDREGARDVARAACEFFFGKNEKGEVIIPEEGFRDRIKADLTRHCAACKGYKRGEDDVVLHVCSEPVCANCIIYVVAQELDLEYDIIPEGYL